MRIERTTSMTTSLDLYPNQIATTKIQLGKSILGTTSSKFTAKRMKLIIQTEFKTNIFTEDIINALYNISIHGNKLTSLNDKNTESALVIILNSLKNTENTTFSKTKYNLFLNKLEKLKSRNNINAQDIIFIWQEVFLDKNYNSRKKRTDYQKRNYDNFSDNKSTEEGFYCNCLPNYSSSSVCEFQEVLHGYGHVQNVIDTLNTIVKKVPIGLSFSDKRLELLIRKIIAKDTGSILESDLCKIESLDCSDDTNIKDFTALKWIPFLHELKINNAQFSAAISIANKLPQIKTLKVNKIALNKDEGISRDNYISKLAAESSIIINFYNASLEHVDISLLEKINSFLQENSLNIPSGYKLNYYAVDLFFKAGYCLQSSILFGLFLSNKINVKNSGALVVFNKDPNNMTEIEVMDALENVNISVCDSKTPWSHDYIDLGKALLNMFEGRMIPSVIKKVPIPWIYQENEFGNGWMWDSIGVERAYIWKVKDTDWHHYNFDYPADTDSALSVLDQIAPNALPENIISNIESFDENISLLLPLFLREPNLIDLLSQLKILNYDISRQEEEYHHFLGDIIDYIRGSGADSENTKAVIAACPDYERLYSSCQNSQQDFLNYVNSLVATWDNLKSLETQFIKIPKMLTYTSSQSEIITLLSSISEAEREQIKYSFENFTYLFSNGAFSEGLTPHILKVLSLDQESRFLISNWKNSQKSFPIFCENLVNTWSNIDMLEQYGYSQDNLDKKGTYTDTELKIISLLLQHTDSLSDIKMSFNDMLSLFQKLDNESLFLNIVLSGIDTENAYIIATTENSPLYFEDMQNMDINTVRAIQTTIYQNELENILPVNTIPYDSVIRFSNMGYDLGSSVLFSYFLSQEINTQFLDKMIIFDKPIDSMSEQEVKEYLPLAKVAVDRWYREYLPLGKALLHLFEGRTIPIIAKKIPLSWLNQGEAFGGWHWTDIGVERAYISKAKDRNWTGYDLSYPSDKEDAIRQLDEISPLAIKNANFIASNKSTLFKMFSSHILDINSEADIDGYYQVVTSLSENYGCFNKWYKLDVGRINYEGIETTGYIDICNNAHNVFFDKGKYVQITREWTDRKQREIDFMSNQLFVNGTEKHDHVHNIFQDYWRHWYWVGFNYYTLPDLIFYTDDSYSENHEKHVRYRASIDYEKIPYIEFKLKYSDIDNSTKDMGSFILGKKNDGKLGVYQGDKAYQETSPEFKAILKSLKNNLIYLYSQYNDPKLIESISKLQRENYNDLFDLSINTSGKIFSELDTEKNINLDNRLQTLFANEPGYILSLDKSLVKDYICQAINNIFSENKNESEALSLFNQMQQMYNAAFPIEELGRFGSFSFLIIKKLQEYIERGIIEKANNLLDLPHNIGVLSSSVMVSLAADEKTAEVHYLIGKKRILYTLGINDEGFVEHVSTSGSVTESPNGSYLGDNTEFVFAPMSDNQSITLTEHDNKYIISRVYQSLIGSGDPILCELFKLEGGSLRLGLEEARQKLRGTGQKYIVDSEVFFFYKMTNIQNDSQENIIPTAIMIEDVTGLGPLAHKFTFNYDSQANKINLTNGKLEVKNFVVEDYNAQDISWQEVSWKLNGLNNSSIDDQGNFIVQGFLEDLLNVVVALVVNWVLTTIGAAVLQWAYELFEQIEIVQDVMSSFEWVHNTYQSVDAFFQPYESLANTVKAISENPQNLLQAIVPQEIKDIQTEVEDNIISIYQDIEPKGLSGSIEDIRSLYQNNAAAENIKVYLKQGAQIIEVNKAAITTGVESINTDLNTIKTRVQVSLDDLSSNVKSFGNSLVKVAIVVKDVVDENVHFPDKENILYTINILRIGNEYKFPFPEVAISDIQASNDFYPDHFFENGQTKPINITMGTTSDNRNMVTICHPDYTLIVSPQAFPTYIVAGQEYSFDKVLDGQLAFDDYKMKIKDVMDSYKKLVDIYGKTNIIRYKEEAEFDYRIKTRSKDGINYFMEGCILQEGKFISGVVFSENIDLLDREIVAKTSSVAFDRDQDIDRQLTYSIDFDSIVSSNKDSVKYYMEQVFMFHLTNLIIASGVKLGRLLGDPENIFSDVGGFTDDQKLPDCSAAYWEKINDIKYQGPENVTVIVHGIGVPDYNGVYTRSYFEKIFPNENEIVIPLVWNMDNNDNDDGIDDGILSSLGDYYGFGPIFGNAQYHEEIKHLLRIKLLRVYDQYIKGTNRKLNILVHSLGGQILYEILSERDLYQELVDIDVNNFITVGSHLMFFKAFTRLNDFEDVCPSKISKWSNIHSHHDQTQAFFCGRLPFRCVKNYLINVGHGSMLYEWKVLEQIKNIYQDD